MTEALLVYRVRTINPEDLHQKHNTVGPKFFIFHGIYFKIIHHFRMDVPHAANIKNAASLHHHLDPLPEPPAGLHHGVPGEPTTSMILACRDSILLWGLCPVMVYKCLTFSIQ